MFFAVPIMHGMATLIEAKTSYTLEDWHDLIEILLVKNENEHRAMESARSRRQVQQERAQTRRRRR